MIVDNNKLWKSIDEEISNSTANNANPRIPQHFLQSLCEYYLNLINHIHALSRPSDSSLSLSHNLIFEMIMDVNFTAYTEIDNNNAKLSISLGALTALQDLFYRGACSKDFYSFDPQKNGERQYMGAECYWLDLGGSLQPERRYLNYEAKIKNEDLEHDKNTFLSCFFTAIPMDMNRRKMADFMLHIATTWILMHEEGHYCEGHLSYLNTNSISEINKNFDSSSINVSKVFEWQADRAAARAIADIIYQEPYSNLLPEYSSENKKGWLIRAIIVSIGTTIMIFKKQQSIIGSFDGYPTERTRLISSIIILYSKLQSNELDGSGLYPFSISNTQDVIDFIYAPILGGLDDLSTISEFINNEGEIESWEVGHAPKIKNTHELNFLSNPQEVSLMAEYIVRKIVPEEISNQLFNKRKDNNFEELWFSELDEIIKFHDMNVHPELAKNRQSIGIYF